MIRIERYFENAFDDAEISSEELRIFAEDHVGKLFPQGLTHYTRATMQTIKQRLDYAVEKFTKYQTELGAPLVAEFEALRTQFNAARDEQVETKGSVGQSRGAVRTTRTALELQLTDNLLALAREFKGQPEKAAEFFDQSLLEDPTRVRDPEVA